jgi:hypothetical protein
VSNVPKVRLEDSQTINHELIKKFVAQIRRGDKLVWDKVILIAQSKCFEHDNPDHVAQLEHLKHLDFYVNKADDVEYDLSQTIWNEEGILKLLQDSHPKGTESNNLDSFVTRVRAIPAQFEQCCGNLL